jgi:hypothetical protein
VRGLSGDRAAQHSHPRGSQLFEGPTLFRRTRKDLAELAGLVWLAIEVVRLVRARLGKPGPA